MFSTFWISNSAPATVANSLRFRGAQFLSLNHEFQDNGKYAISVWLKRGTLTTTQGIFSRQITSNASHIRFTNADKIQCTAAATAKSSNSVYRDPSAWYHIFSRKTDSPATTAEMYINGILVPEVDVLPNLSSDSTLDTNIGRKRDGQTEYFDGYMAEFHVVTNATVANLPSHTDFGEFDADGVWVPKEYTGAYGDGFYLDFSDPAAIGADRSGNGNNFTPNGFELADQTSPNWDHMDDSPVNNYAVINPLYPGASTSNANLTTANTTGKPTLLNVSGNVSVSGVSVAWNGTEADWDSTGNINFGQQPNGLDDFSTNKLPSAPIPNGRDHFRSITGPGSGDNPSTPGQFGWNSQYDIYSRNAVKDRLIGTQVKMRRCLLNDDGTVANYLDADDSTLLAGDWLRLVETSELDSTYNGTHGAETANDNLRSGVSAWAAGSYSAGDLVTHDGSVWEALTATSNEPAAGTSAATLDGTAGQVMVEIPLFSVRHDTAASGSQKDHTFYLFAGTKTDDSFAVHPAFVKPDNSTRDFIYVSAYMGTGSNGSGCASGVNNAVSMKVANARTSCAARGSGWTQYTYWCWNALQWLCMSEYENVNGRKVVGNGALAGSATKVHTGFSDKHGNRSANDSTSGNNVRYMSYRGIENFWGRCYQYIDGFTWHNREVWITNNPADFANSTTANYTSYGTIANSGSSGAWIRDLTAGSALLADNISGASATTYCGCKVYNKSGWEPGRVGGAPYIGNGSGMFCVLTSVGFGNGAGDTGTRLVYREA